MPGRQFTSGSYRYGFNGKEKDDEVAGNGNQIDYGFRVQDPRLGRFLSVDPLTKKYPWWTPYQYAGNNVIKHVDIDGAEVEDDENNVEEPVRVQLRISLNEDYEKEDEDRWEELSLEEKQRELEDFLKANAPKGPLTGLPHTSPYEIPLDLQAPGGGLDLPKLQLLNSAYNEGLIKFTSTEALNNAERDYPQSTTVGDPNGAFVTTGNVGRNLLEQYTSGWITREELGEKLGLNKEQNPDFYKGDLVVFSMSPAQVKNVIPKFATGKEKGVNSKFNSDNPLEASPGVPQLVVPVQKTNSTGEIYKSPLTVKPNDE